MQSHSTSQMTAANDIKKEYLKSMNVTDIGSIPIYSENYIKKSENFTKVKIEYIMFSEVLSSLK